MVAGYKRKRLAEWMSSDVKPKKVGFEGSERSKGKREALAGIAEADLLTDRKQLQEDRWDEEVALAMACWEREQAFGEGYVCNCYDKIPVFPDPDGAEIEPKILARQMVTVEKLVSMYPKRDDTEE